MKGDKVYCKVICIKRKTVISRIAEHLYLLPRLCKRN